MQGSLAETFALPCYGDGASMNAQVFGGLASCNDLSFHGETQEEYEQLSDKLFTLLNAAMEAAATSSTK
ncbi:MAG: hypothetical protein WAM85_01780 [Terracidiphilus sp.]